MVLCVSSPEKRMGTLYGTVGCFGRCDSGSALHVANSRGTDLVLGKRDVCTLSFCAVHIHLRHTENSLIVYSFMQS